MAVEVEIDVELLKSEIKKTYASVSEQPQTEFIFPTGRAWAEDLGYPDELTNVPEGAVESFAGVANPWTMGRLAEGERVLDLGSGAGTDSLIAGIGADATSPRTAILIVAVLTGASGLLVAATSWQPRPVLRPAAAP